ncbi:SAV_2336 N-terminal domain-related protein [Actinomadura mexicana]|uniref:DNA segregation ATPase FtsK/SpoIIIE n=1 Tax=Actinomadura mexicana TaxID=134959 RepID=A0A238WYT6_9ACTN|nr:SAV_2336 N-terminal domain-related protein [Actinomadura mexicana]SNR51727.1 DNA segregation ATPase FtsK/SpoIIIE [Actinomadura mexicana]
MTIDRLRDALSAIGPPPDARELSEMLWLACHVSPPAERPFAVPPVPPPVADEPVDAPAPPEPPEPAAPRPSEPLTELHPRPGAGAEPAGRASEVLVPTAPMLADPLGVQRALRPLKRRVPSRHRVELDEDATAARIADTRLWTPVLVPSPERWLGLSLVVDTGPTMRLWRPLARELAETLLRQGAFRDVRLGYLDGKGRVASAPEAPPQDPGTLLDASGRRAVLVLSDCSGPHWWNGRAVQAVRRWAQAGPTAIVQPLAERLWRRTAAPASPGLAVLPRPGAPNTDLRFAPYDGAAGAGVPVPVLEIAPRWFGAWARLVSGSEPQPAAIAILPGRPSGAAPVRRERELPVAERVRRFLATASPAAAELAAHVAVSVPSLPVMRLIQHRILGGSGPGQLAEVLLSGLLRPAGGVRYEFVPGAREALLDTLPRPEALHTRHVLEAVSAEIERRAGTTAETFRALLPADGGPVVLTADTDHFALVTPQARSHLTPAPAPAAPDLLELLGTPVEELVGDGWDRGPRPAVIGVDGDDLVSVDVLHGHPDLPHGLITGPRASRDALLRTLVLSLALDHAPTILNFAFVDFDGGVSFAGLNRLPHVARSISADSVNSWKMGTIAGFLETERRHRENVLQAAGVTTWDEYQAAIAGGRPLDPLPALVVVIDNAGPLLNARSNLLDPLAALCEAGPAQGLRFVFCSPNDSLTQPELSGFAGWNIGFPSRMGDHLASVHIFAQEARPAFEPARISLDAVRPIVRLMQQRGLRARQVPWPQRPVEPVVPAQESSAQPSVLPEFDVLRLNGGGSDGMLRETWALPADMPRSPTIGYRPGGHLLGLYPLDASSGIPHGLVVGSPEARQKVVRAITLALAAGYSPADLRFVFAGLGEHPLGEPIDLPHVRHSEEELLGSPERLRRFFDLLSGELDERSAGPSQNVPRAANPGTDQWTVDEMYERYRRDPHSVDRVWWDFFDDYQPGERPAALSTPQPETRPRLLVVADLSLTFPLSRREVGETLLSLAQRGRALGVQLLLTSSTVETTTIWDRLLPLLGWRIAASRLPPDQLQRVLGQASLQFPDGERTAYLLAGGGSPRRFTVAPEPPREAVDDFVRRTREYFPPTSADAAPGGAGLGADRRLLDGLDEAIASEQRTMAGEPVDGAMVRAALQEILRDDAETARAGRSRRLRHLLFPAPYRPEMLMTAKLYARMLAELGVLPRRSANRVAVRYGDSAGNAPTPYIDASGARYGFDPTGRVAEIFRANRGSVLLIRDISGEATSSNYLHREIINKLVVAMRNTRDNTLVVLCGRPSEWALLSTVPGFTDRFRSVHAFNAKAAPPRSPSIPRSPSVRLGSDPETGEPVLLDFGTDRHLLISGPSDSQKSPLVHRMAEELASTGTERDRLVYVLDTYMSPHDLADAEARRQAGVRYTASPEEFGGLLDEVIRSAEIPLGGTGPEVYVLVAHRRRPVRDDPLAAAVPVLRTMREHGVHLVLAHHQITAGEPLDPVVALLRRLGAPALLTGRVGGQEADLWDVPTTLQGPLEAGDALLAHPGRQRLVRLGNPTG